MTLMIEHINSNFKKLKMEWQIWNFLEMGDREREREKEENV